MNVSFQTSFVLFRIPNHKEKNILLHLQKENQFIYQSTNYFKKMDKENSIKALQLFATGLSEGAYVHKLQGQIFKSQGFNKLGEKYVNHFSEEMGWVEKFVDRILDLGCDIEFVGMKERALITDPVAYIKADLDIQKAGVELLYKCMETLTNDPTTYDIMKAYLADEEEDLYWDEEQLDLIEKIGVQNWLVKQM